MKTYLYVDVYFILNFIMNLFLILTTALIRQKRCRFLRFLFLSAVNASLSVGFTYFLWGNTILQLAAAMVQIGIFVFLSFEREGCLAWLGNMACFLFLAFFAGGMIGAMQGVLTRSLAGREISSIGCVLSAVFILFLLFFLFRWELISQEQERRNIRTVKVMHRGKEVTIQALYDTGNQLVSPYTGESVVIVSKELSETIGLSDGQNPVLIPYHSIGGSGLLSAYRLECIQMKDGGCKKELLAAVSEELDYRRKIQMILNIT